MQESRYGNYDQGNLDASTLTTARNNHVSQNNSQSPRPIDPPKHLKSNVLNDDHQLPNDTEGSIGEFAKQIKANDDSTNLVSQNLGSMPRV